MPNDFWKPYRESDKRYMPAITKARWVRRFQIGSYQAVVGTDCESVGLIHYTHVMYVINDKDKHSCLAVTSEYTDNIGNDGNRCLCLFFGGSHFNSGVSKDWIDLDNFVHRALELIIEPLGITEIPQEIPLQQSSGQ